MSENILAIDTKIDNINENLKTVLQDLYEDTYKNILTYLDNVAEGINVKWTINMRVDTRALRSLDKHEIKIITDLNKQLDRIEQLYLGTQGKISKHELDAIAGEYIGD